MLSGPSSQRTISLSSGVLSATSFSLCVFDPRILSPRVQGLPSAFREPKSFIKLRALEPGCHILCTLGAASEALQISTSLAADHQKVPAHHLTWCPGICPSTHAPITVQVHAKVMPRFPSSKGDSFFREPCLVPSCALDLPVCLLISSRGYPQILSRPSSQTGSFPSQNPQPVRGLTASVLVAEIGEAPHVGQIYCEADHRQEEVDFLAPGLPGLLIAVAGRQEALDAVALFHHQDFFALPRGLLRPRARPAVLRLHLRVHPRQKHGCGW